MGNVTIKPLVFILAVLNIRLGSSFLATSWI